MSEQLDINQTIKGTEYAATSATGNATITITNYYYRENFKVAPVEFTGASPNEDIPCPYRGLFHFGPDDAEFFFGRELFVEELVAATQNNKFIPVLGASGSGKSSIVLAGLLPRLQKAGHWKFSHFRPGSDPFHALALALVPLYTPELDTTERIAQARKLAGYFRDGNVFLSDVFSQIQQQHPNCRLLLIADQFEELYTLCNDEAIRRNFIDTLLISFQSLSSKFPSPIVLVATMRADFLGNLLSYPALADVLRNTDVKIRSMNHEELSQVIEKPAKKLGVTFESGLVERILDDVEDEPGFLPLLEFALTELWERRTAKQLTHAAYQEIGEVSGALATYADQIYSNLSTTERSQMRRIFIQLVRPGEGVEDTRRVATKAELGEASWILVKQLADARLVVTSRNAANQETVEIVHEALIRNWNTLQQWMKTDRNFRAWQERLRVAISQWEKTQQEEGALLRGAALAEAEETLQERQDDLSQSEQDFILASVALRDRDKREQERVRRLTILGLTGGFMIAFGLAGVAGWQWQQSEIAQVETLTQSSLNLLSSNQPFEALITSLQAGKLLKRTFWADRNTHMQVVSLLQQTISEVRERNSLVGHSDPVKSVSFSPDGKTLASASIDQTIKVWNITTGKLINTLSGHNASVNSVSFSPDGKTLASASADKTIKVWNITTGKLINTLSGHNASVNSVSFSPDGKTLASASADKTIKVWNVTTGKLLNSLSGHVDPVNSVSFSPDGKTLASASADKTIKIWNVTTGKLLNSLSGHVDPVNSVSFSHDGKTLASASADKTIKVWNVTTGKLLNSLSGHIDPVNSVSFSHDGKTLASASGDKTIKVWNVTTGKLLNSLSGHVDPVNSVSFSHDGKTLASASDDKSIKVWNVTIDKRLNTLTGHNSSVNSVSFSPDKKTLASASNDKTVKLWDSTTGKLLNTLDGHKGWVRSVSFSPDRKTLASAGDDQTIKLWDSTTGKLLNTLDGHKGWVRSVSFSPDGKTLASAGDDQTIKLWDSTTGKLLNTLYRHKGWVRSVSFSPDGKTLASAGDDQTIKLWDSTTGKLLNSLFEHSGRVYSVSFSPDGKTLASAGDDQTIKLWDSTTGKLLNTLNGHKNRINSVSFSPNSKTLASASDDKTIKLWDTTTGEILNTFIKHSNSANSISFSLDGQNLASASDDRKIILWALNLDLLNLKLDNLLVRNCNEIRVYLQNNPRVSKSDKHLCDDIAK
ncbi:hypothetical protein [Nostoc sp. FACHB-145]|uniref:nSTAND1 domain-containing NTPase n=1 Tax=Nostoc sp. FACHB-145 TaxID=2692836 RepID=UPI0016879680|nr:hypothetical protein [Nostoc sp. FACHB-145]MBD2473078.1 hypothetical protein [Nostoc sp. FACHB-145]